MNDVPLIRKTDVNDINTSLIAIKKQLKQLNEAVGLIDVPDVDLTPFVRKDEVVNVIESGNMNPVTSNAVASISKVVPDYAQGNQITNGATSYTPSEDVYLMYCKTSSSNNARLSIGGVNDLCCYNSYGGTWTITFNGIIKKGTVITMVYKFIIKITKTTTFC